MMLSTEDGPNVVGVTEVYLFDLVCTNWTHLSFSHTIITQLNAKYENFRLRATMNLIVCCLSRLVREGHMLSPWQSNGPFQAYTKYKLG